MKPDQPFHEGEIAVQERTGERPIALRLTGLLRHEIMPAARPFLATQRLLAVAVADPQGRPWASLWLGARGFLHTDDGSVVDIERARLFRSEDDPAEVVLGAPLGLLAIDLESRRRLRINGIVSELDANRLAIAVHESYPNCPKYIQRRVLRPGTETTPEPTVRGSVLDARRRELVARIDTLFVASRHPTRGLDASHRGGEAGFVRVLDERTLRLPDYPGNSLFNTLGNFAVDPHAGLALIDFERGRVLSLTGTVTVTYDAPDDPTQPSGGTGRYWTVRVDEWIDFALPAPVGWELVDRSPFNPARTDTKIE